MTVFTKIVNRAALRPVQEWALRTQAGYANYEHRTYHLYNTPTTLHMCFILKEKESLSDIRIDLTAFIWSTFPLQPHTEIHFQASTTKPPAHEIAATTLHQMRMDLLSFLLDLLDTPSRWPDECSTIWADGNIKILEAESRLGNGTLVTEKCEWNMSRSDDGACDRQIEFESMTGKGALKDDETLLGRAATIACEIWGDN